MKIKMGDSVQCKQEVEAWDGYYYRNEEGSLKSTISYLRPGINANVIKYESNGYIADFISKISGIRRCFILKDNVIKV